MKIYNYSPVTGEYLGESVAETVLGAVLIPAHATQLEPPAAQAGFAVCFLDGKWNRVADQRGEVWFDPTGKEVKIVALGAVPDSSWTRTAPPPPPPTVQDKINTLESSITPRRLREALLGTDNGWLRNIDTQIAALRATLK